MDFFATGGFQQLFSDLNSTDELEFEKDFDCHATPMNASEFVYPAAGTSTTALTDYQNASINPASSNIDENPSSVNVDFFNMNHGSHCGDSESSSIFSSELTTLNAAVITKTQTMATYGDFSNNDSHSNSQSSEMQLQHELDYLLTFESFDISHASMECISPTVDTDALISREIAEWEEKFLDNYIEIPELVDILPEKTPLCTDNCEMFLEESSQHLRLKHKQKVKTKTKMRRQHLSEQVIEKGYPCTFNDCQKIYAKPAHLKAHLRRHMGEKPYICNWPDCIWKFSRSDELARHRRSHSGVKPYECQYCTKCFARSDHLTKHRKVHERRMLAASRAGEAVNGVLPRSVFTVRPGRKRKNQVC